MTLPTGTSRFISRTVGMVAAGVGGVFWARGTISLVGVIALLMSIHLLAWIAAELEPEAIPSSE